MRYVDRVVNKKISQPNGITAPEEATESVFFVIFSNLVDIKILQR